MSVVLSNGQHKGRPPPCVHPLGPRAYQIHSHTQATSHTPFKSNKRETNQLPSSGSQPRTHLFRSPKTGWGISFLSPPPKSSGCLDDPAPGSDVVYVYAAASLIFFGWENPCVGIATDTARVFRCIERTHALYSSDRPFCPLWLPAPTGGRTIGRAFILPPSCQSTDRPIDRVTNRIDLFNHPTTQACRPKDRSIRSIISGQHRLSAISAPAQHGVRHAAPGAAAVTQPPTPRTRPHHTTPTNGRARRRSSNNISYQQAQHHDRHPPAPPAGSGHTRPRLQPCPQHSTITTTTPSPPDHPCCYWQ